VRFEAVKIEGDQRILLSALHMKDVVELVKLEKFVWIDVDISSATERALYEFLVERLDFHPATVQDCLQPTSYHQPKIDEEQEYKFITFLYYEQRPNGELIVRELNIYASETYVITVHRHGCAELLAEFRKLPRHIEEYDQRAVLFLHHILDVVVDSYAKIMRDLQQKSDQMEISILQGRRRRMISLRIFHRHEDEMADMRQILLSRQSLVMLRRTLAGELRIINQLIGEYDFEGASEKSEEIAIYFRDIADHVRKYLEIIESEDRSLNHLMEVHTLVTSYRTNEIIYLLTLISTVMLPLNLIVGFFGMNFDNLWFAHHPLGIWLVFFSMILLSAGLFAFFRAKGWI
jgi:magnesium transporter